MMENTLPPNEGEEPVRRLLPLKQCEMCLFSVGSLSRVEGEAGDYWFDKVMCPPCARIVNFKKGVTQFLCSVCSKLLSYYHTGRFRARVKECRVCGKVFCDDCVGVNPMVMCVEIQGHHVLDSAGYRGR